MKFEDLYPGVPEDFQPPDRGHDVVPVGQFRPCWHCGWPTRWAELNFLAHLCSEECDDAKWKEYFEALKGKGGEEDDSPLHF